MPIVLTATRQGDQAARRLGIGKLRQQVLWRLVEVTKK